MVSKRCTKCHELLEINATNFYRDTTRSKDGFRAECKKCSNKRHKEYYKNNLDKRKEYLRKNKEQIRATEKAYKRAHRVKNRELGRLKRERLGLPFLRFYSEVHRWAKKNKPKKSYCQICNEYGHKLELANISQEYKRDINDYMWLCHSCHLIYDFSYAKHHNINILNKNKAKTI